MRCWLADDDDERNMVLLSELLFVWQYVECVCYVLRRTFIFLTNHHCDEETATALWWHGLCWWTTPDIKAKEFLTISGYCNLL